MGSEKDEAVPKVAAIAKPLADPKLTKKIYKLIKRGAPHLEATMPAGAVDGHNC